VATEWAPVRGAGAEVTTETIARANAAMDALLASEETLLKGVRVTTEVTTGRAFVEILDRARTWRADLVVLGPRGAASLDLERVFLGSTAERVATSATCSVLVARPRHRGAHPA
jgi:nucleotide-binding universal stress UspA family protein